MLPWSTGGDERGSQWILCCDISPPKNISSRSPPSKPTLNARIPSPRKQSTHDYRMMSSAESKWVAHVPMGNPFHNDKQIKSNLIFQRFWALSIVQATSTCLANGTLASTVPQGDLLTIMTIMGIRSFPQNIHNCTSDMDIMATTSSLGTAKQIGHRLLLTHKMTLTNKNIKQ